VLVVDDDDEVRRVMADLVASRGYTVSEASDGHEAWQKLLRSPADLVVTDLQMPHCDGTELCRRIRSHPAMRHVRILIVTGCEKIPDSHRVHCDRLLSKPVSMSALLEELDQMRVAVTAVRRATAF
jgi:CheY-like chemotaxis protein